MIITQNEFVKREIAVWGEDHVDDLIDRGFLPVLITDSNGNSKWVWKETPTRVTVLNTR